MEVIESIDGTILVEVHEISKSGRTRVSGGSKVVEKTVEQVDAAVDAAVQVAERAAHQFGKMDNRPDEVQIKLGVKLTAEAGVLFAKAASEGNFEITLTWKREAPNT